MQAGKGNAGKCDQTFLGNNDGLWWVNFVAATQNSDFPVQKIHKNVTQSWNGSF